MILFFGLWFLFAVTFVTSCGRTKTEADIKAEERFQRAVAGALTVRDATRNPANFKVESVLIIGDGRVVCYQYRGENAFGGMNRGRAVLIGDNIVGEGADGFIRAWNKECANKSGEEKVRVVERALSMVR